MAVAETRWIRLQQGAVLDSANWLVRGVPVGNILEGRTNGEHAETVAHGDGLASPEGGEGKVESRIGVHQLLGERRVHVVNVGDAGEPLHGGGDECGLFNCVDEIVPIPAYHPGAFQQHEKVANHLLQREACTDVPDPQRAGDSVNPAVGDVDVLALVERQQIKLVSPRAQKLEHPSDCDRSAPRLEEWVWGENENSHPTGSATLLTEGVTAP
jgi:hypothetical protein